MVEKPRRERQRRLLKMGYDAPDIRDAVATYEQTIVDMERTLAHQDWLAGDRFSLADAAMAPYFQTLYQFGWCDWYRSRNRVADWYARCVERESYRTGVGGGFSRRQRWRNSMTRDGLPGRKYRSISAHESDGGAGAASTGKPPHALVQAAVRRAEELQVRVNVAVVDSGGHLAAFLRMPGLGVSFRRRGHQQGLHGHEFRHADIEMGTGDGYPVATVPGQPAAGLPVDDLRWRRARGD